MGLTTAKYSSNKMSSYSAYLAQRPDRLGKNIVYMCVDMRLNNMKEKDQLEDPDIDGKIILRWIFRKWDLRVWNGSSWLRKGTSGGNL